MKNCCDKLTKRNKTCRRKDGKIFKLPRRFTKKRCQKGVRGFTMKSSCAPYKYCKTRRFHFNPKDPKNSFDVYIDKNPADTIKIKYTTPEDVKNTINKLERLYKSRKYSHQRIWQVGMIMKVRLEVIKKRHPKVPTIRKRFSLANRYFYFLKKRTATDEKTRRSMTFHP